MSEDPSTSTPWSTALDKFLAMVLASRLLGIRGLNKALEGQEAADVSAVSDHLVASGALTHWQCEKLRNGRYKGFFLGPYKLLDQPSEAEPYFLVEEYGTHRRTTIAIEPNPEWLEGIEYRVVD